MPSIEPDVFPQGPDFWRIAEPEAPSGHLRTDEQEASAPQQESESQQQNIYHVYMVKEPSRKHEAGPAIWQEEDELEPAEKTPHASSLRKPHYRILFPLMLVVLVVVGVLAGSLVGYLTQATTAQVTLIPAQHPVTLTTTLAVVTTGIGGSSGEQTILGRA